MSARWHVPQLAGGGKAGGLDIWQYQPHSFPLPSPRTCTSTVSPRAVCAMMSVQSAMVTSSPLASASSKRDTTLFSSTFLYSSSCSTAASMLPGAGASRPLRCGWGPPRPTRSRALSTSVATPSSLPVRACEGAKAAGEG